MRYRVLAATLNSAAIAFVHAREISQNFAEWRLRWRVAATKTMVSVFPPANDGRFRANMGKDLVRVAAPSGGWRINNRWGRIMLRSLIAGSVVVLGVALLVDGTVEGKDKELTIKQVMKKAHQPAKKGEVSLLKKVLEGDASKDEKADLVKLYEALAKCTPPMGEKDDWKDKTKALIAAAKGDNVDALKTASNCMACHDAHKKKKKE
jgi:hypothetical protein